MSLATFKTAGYSLPDGGGSSGAFSWYAPAEHCAKWMVQCTEKSFVKDAPFSHAVVDNFGNLVRVPA